MLIVIFHGSGILFKHVSAALAIEKDQITSEIERHKKSLMSLKAHCHF